MADCTVCCEKYNSTNHKKIDCLYCQAGACRTCVQRFLIENTIVPQCMSCKREWNMEFLRGSLTRSFMNKDYRDHQKDALLSEAEAEIGLWQDWARFETRREESQVKIRKLKLAVTEAKRALVDAQHEYFMMERNERPGAVAVAVESEEERRQFYMACPRDECRGQVSSGYKCGLCAHFFCSKCHLDKGMERDAEHECKQEDVDTVALLRENTHACPKCHTGIYKVSGCDQMWCVECHTCFSWRTGNILNGPVHNPHFYEHQRRNGGGEAPRALGDIPCGGLPHVRYFHAKVRRDGGDNEHTRELFKIHRMTNHIIDLTMPRTMNKFNNTRAETQRSSGIKYLRGMMDRMGWRDSLYRAARQEEKYRRYYQILEMLTVNISEIIRQYVGDAMSGGEAHRACTTLLDYANEESIKMNKQFQMSLPRFHPNMATDRL